MHKKTICVFGSHQIELPMLSAIKNNQMQELKDKLEKRYNKLAMSKIDKSIWNIIWKSFLTEGM